MATHLSALDKIARLVVEPRDVVSLWHDVSPILMDVVPHMSFPCWYTVDPASLLITSHYNPYLTELPRESMTLEYCSDDVNALVDVARSPSGISTLHDATGGRPENSPRWQANMDLGGGDQEMVAALRTRDDAVWGGVGLYRGEGEPLFDEADKRFVQQASTHLGEGARRALLFGEATDPDAPTSPGLVVLDEHWQIESSTPGTAEWLADLPDADGSRLPTAVRSVAAQALRDGGIAVARVLSRSGRWVILHGGALQGPTPRVAVIVEPAHPARIIGLLMAAYQLTGREQDVTRLVLQGQSTSDIADALFLSPHTVQQHLKQVFEKTGVRSRRDLVGKVFFQHYEPRVRDNEARVPESKPLRGGPASA